MSDTELLVIYAVGFLTVLQVVWRLLKAGSDIDMTDGADIAMCLYIAGACALLWPIAIAVGVLAGACALLVEPVATVRWVRSKVRRGAAGE